MRHRGQRTVLLAVLWVIVGLGSLVQGRTGRAGEWTLPDSRQGVRTAPLLLLSRPDVQAELHLDQSQSSGGSQPDQRTDPPRFGPARQVGRGRDRGAAGD